MHRGGHPELAGGLPDGQPLDSEVKGSIDIDDGGGPTTLLALTVGHVKV